MQKEDAYTLDDLLEKAKVYIKSDEDIELIKKALVVLELLIKLILILL